MKTLVLVDAQSGFWYNASKISHQLIYVLHNALDQGQRIIVLELSVRTFGHTHDSLRKYISAMDQQNVCYKEKFQDSGAAEVMQAMQDNDWSPEHGFSICGVNLCYCVFSTAVDLVKNHNVDLILPATACWDNCECTKDINKAVGSYMDYNVSVSQTIKEPKEHVVCV